MREQNLDIDMICVDGLEEKKNKIEILKTQKKINNQFNDMEIDISIENESKEDKDIKTYLIIDTNFFLKHLDIIIGLKQIAKKNGLLLIIPSTVINELDGLKKSVKKDYNLNNYSDLSIDYLARCANDWIYDSLSQNNEVIKGQKFDEKIHYNLDPDDSILDCCLFFKNKNKNSQIVLMSNDKILCSKALSNEILTISFRQHMTAFVIANFLNEEKNKTKKNYSESTFINTVNLKNDFNQIENNTQETFFLLMSKIYNEVQEITQHTVKHCMNESYKEDINNLIDYDKDLTTLKSCSYVIIRFWIPVFLTYFQNLPDKFKPFNETFVKKKSVKKSIYTIIPISINELKSFIKFWSKFLISVFKVEFGIKKTEFLNGMIEKWNAIVSNF